jgi:chromosome segregation ATPase
LVQPSLEIRSTPVTVRPHETSCPRRGDHRNIDREFSRPRRYPNSCSPKIIEQKGKVSALDAEITSHNDETQKIYDDQPRMRENLKARKGSAEERALTQRYTQQLNDQETRLEAIERELKDRQAKRAQAQQELDKTIENLSLEAKL